jgi:hypothetical protein
LSGANHSTAEALKGAPNMSQSTFPAAARELDSAGPASHVRSNVIPFPVHRRPVQEPPLEPHTDALHELAQTIASEIVAPQNDAELHERAYAEVLDMLCKLTPMLVTGMRARILPRM